MKIKKHVTNMLNFFEEVLYIFQIKYPTLWWIIFRKKTYIKLISLTLILLVWQIGWLWVTDLFNKSIEESSSNREKVFYMILDTFFWGSWIFIIIYLILILTFVIWKIFEDKWAFSNKKKIKEYKLRLDLTNNKEEYLYFLNKEFIKISNLFKNHEIDILKIKSKNRIINWFKEEQIISDFIDLNKKEKLNTQELSYLSFLENSKIKLNQFDEELWKILNIFFILQSNLWTHYNFNTFKSLINNSITNDEERKNKWIKCEISSYNNYYNWNKLYFIVNIKKQEFKKGDNNGINDMFTYDIIDQYIIPEYIKEIKNKIFPKRDIWMSDEKYENILQTEQENFYKYLSEWFFGISNYRVITENDYEYWLYEDIKDLLKKHKKKYNKWVPMDLGL